MVVEVNKDFFWDFKMAEFGLLPEDWQVVRLGEVIALERGVSWSKSDEATSGIGVLGIPNIRENGRVDLTPRVRILKNIPPEKWVTQGDVLLAGSSGSIQNVGRVGVVSDDSVEPLTYASFTVRARVSDSRMDQIFLPFLLRSPWVKFSMFSKRAADGKYNLQVQQLRDHLVPLPPLPEQRAIAHVLRTVQRAKEATERVIQATRELKKSLMRHLFTYGPVPVNEVERVPLKETEIGPVPEHWELVKLGEVLKLSSGKTRPSQMLPYPKGQFRFPVYGGNGIIGYSAEYLVTDPTIVIGRVGVYCGNVFICPGQSWISDNALYAKKVFLKNVNLEFLCLALRFLNLNRLKKKSAQPLITQGAINSQPLPLPPLSEQREIARILGAVDKKLQAEEARKQALEALFKTLLHNLMTGKIRVNNISLPENTEVK